MRDFFKNQYVLHSLGALAVIVVLVAGFLFWLKGYTRHDQTTPTPDLQGMDATLAVQTLEAMGFRWTIIDSSRYEPDKRPRAVLSQDPSAGTAVKEGRKIYLKINRSSWETVSVPTVDLKTTRSKTSPNACKPSGLSWATPSTARTSAAMSCWASRWTVLQSIRATSSPKRPSST